MNFNGKKQWKEYCQRIRRRKVERHMATTITAFLAPSPEDNFMDTITNFSDRNEPFFSPTINIALHVYK
jgi:hypothetical protein